jgi:hypothetical protein
MSENLAYFDIDPVMFSRIHTRELKQKYLRYKYLRKELDIIQQAQNNFENKLQECERFYQSLADSELMASHQQIYSKHSRGLQEIDIRTVRATASSTDHMMSSVLEIKRKESGIEPGFEGIQTETILMTIDHVYPHASDRRAYMMRFRADIKSMYEDMKNIVPKYLIKFAFEEMHGDKLIPSERNIQQTRAVKKLDDIHPLLGQFATLFIKISKTTTIGVKNIEAVREVLANDYLRVCGMLVQDQVLYVGESENGLMQLMPKGLWDNDASPLGKIAGGLADNHYLVRALIKTYLKIAWISRNDILKLAMNYPGLLEVADHDAVGSSAQNKLRRDNQLFGIDSGHPFQDVIIDDVDGDFHLNRAKFKNYSIFYDRPRSEFVAGVLMLAKLSGRSIPPAIVKSHGEALAKIDEVIEPFADLLLFEDYTRKFEQLAQLFLPGSKNNQTCLTIVRDIGAMRSKSQESRKKLLDKFSHYLVLPAPYIDLVENLEKLMLGRNNLSPYSEDGTVVLNHLRMKARPNMQWQFSYDELGNTWTLEVKFSSSKSQQEAYQHLLNWEPLKSVYITMENDRLVIRANTAVLDRMVQLCADDVIKSVYFPEDWMLYQACKNEIEVQVGLERLKQQGVLHALENSPTHAANYRLTLQVKEGTDHRVDWYKVIKQQFSDFALSQSDDAFSFEFQQDNLGLLLRLINDLPDKLQRQLQLKRGLLEFQGIDQSVLGESATLKLVQSGDNCYLHILSNTHPIFTTMLKRQLAEYKMNDQYVITSSQITHFNHCIRMLIESYVAIRSNIVEALGQIEYTLSTHQLLGSITLREQNGRFILACDVSKHDEQSRALLTALEKQYGKRNQSVWDFEYTELNQLASLLATTIAEHSEKIKQESIMLTLFTREHELRQKSAELEEKKVQLQQLARDVELVNQQALFSDKMVIITTELKRLLVDLDTNKAFAIVDLASSAFNLFSRSSTDSHVTAQQLLEEIHSFLDDNNPTPIKLRDLMSKLQLRYDFVKSHKDKQRYLTQADLITVVIADLAEALLLHPSKDNITQHRNY